MQEIGTRLWMACDVLQQGPALSPDQAWQLSQEYRRITGEHADREAEAIVPKEDTFRSLLAEANGALCGAGETARHR